VAVWKGQLARVLGATVLGAPAEQRHLDPLTLVQASERPGAVGGHVAGDEQHRLHSSTCR
jgi:hypothetical protein